jgi:hypothetical protein
LAQKIANFDNLDIDEQKSIFDAMFPVEKKSGETIIEQVASDFLRPLIVYLRAKKVTTSTSSRLALSTSM